MDVIHGREEAAIAGLREAMREADDLFSLFDLRRTGNGLIVLLAHGHCNHRYEPVTDLFRWVAAELPDSYSLLYVHDDDDHGRGGRPREPVPGVAGGPRAVRRAGRPVPVCLG
jgi:hypothetical protein